MVVVGELPMPGPLWWGGGHGIRPVCSELSWEAACITSGIPAAATDAEQRAVARTTGARH